jgi:hypothetical protein
LLAVEDAAVAMVLVWVAEAVLVEFFTTPLHIFPLALLPLPLVQVVRLQAEEHQGQDNQADLEVISVAQVVVEKKQFLAAETPQKPKSVHQVAAGVQVERERLEYLDKVTLAEIQAVRLIVAVAVVVLAEQAEQAAA